METLPDVWDDVPDNCGVAMRIRRIILFLKNDGFISCKLHIFCLQCFIEKKAMVSFFSIDFYYRRRISLKKCILALLSCLCMFSASATTFAHTHLGSTSPAEGDTVTEPLTEITLTFEGQIEQGSTFELEKAEGGTVELQSISVADGIMTGTLAAPLINGDYLVQWSSISSDGHPMEGEFAFTVAVPVTEQTAEQTQPAEDEAAPIADENQAEQEETSPFTSPMLVIVVALVLVMAASFFFLLKRRK